MIASALHTHSSNNLKRPVHNFIKLLGVLAALLCPAAGAFAQYILGTPNSTLNSDGWALTASTMTGVYGAITSSANFGPGAIDTRSVSVTNLSSITSGTLAGINGLMVPWWNNSQSAPYQSAVISAFQSGMDLWLLEDDSSHNGIGTALGVISSPAANAPSNGTSPFYVGPFGTATNTLVSGNFDQFTNIPALGGTIGATNSSGQVTVAYWARGAFSPGSGALVIFGDVDMISNYTATFGPPNADGILALNTVAWLAAGAQAIPEPSSYALMGLGGVVLLVRRWRSTRAAR